MRLPSHPIFVQLAVLALSLLVVLICFVIKPDFFRPAPVIFGRDDFHAPVLQAKAISFGEVDGWAEDELTQALPVFWRSCEKILPRADKEVFNALEVLGNATSVQTLSGKVRDWRAACEGAGAMLDSDKAADTQAVRAFFERHFLPVEISTKAQPKQDAQRRGAKARIVTEGKFTGYFEPIYEGRRRPAPPFDAPVYTRPTDLITVDLGRFRPDMKGQQLVGFEHEGKLFPYPDHAAINDGMIKSRANVIVYMDPTDLLFMQIQGSGSVLLPDGKKYRLGYAGKNGHPYTAVGKVLVERGEASIDEMSMDYIRQWLNNAQPHEAKVLREKNKSYVFFRELKDLLDPDLGPLGANGVQLTGDRSLAVDRRYYGLGAPVFVSIDSDETQGEVGAIRRLFIAQDTGGAIRGPIRGDIYFGAGVQAGSMAGSMNANGTITLLLPKSLAHRIGIAPSYQS